MSSIDPTSSRVARGGALEHLRRGLSAALMVVVQATFVASALLLAPIAVVPAGAAAVSATLDQCANGGKGGPRLACLLSQWQNGNINGNNSQYAEGNSVPFRALITVPNAGTHNIWIQFDNTKASKHAYDYLTSWNTTETGDPTSGTGVSNASPTTFPITTPSNVFCSGGFVGGPGVVAGNFTMYGGGTLTAMSYTTVAGGDGKPSSCTGDQSVTVKVTFTTTAGRDLILAWGGHIATQQNWGPGTSAINISGSPYHQRILQIDTTGIGNQDRSLKASAVLVPPVITSQVSHATAGQSGSISLGETITDTATVSGSAGTPAGTVDFYVCGPGLPTAVDATGCPGVTTHVGAQKTLDNSGHATSDPYTPATVGFYCFRLVYTSAANSQYLNGTHTNHTTECFNVVGATIHILKTANPAGPVSAGTAIGFDITVTNTGAGTATGIVVSDDLPAGADLDWSLDPAFTGCAITGLIGSQTLDCTFTSLAGPSGSIGPIHVTSATTKDDCAIVSNTADVSAGNDGTDSSTDTVTVQCGDIHILKTANPAGPVSAGTAIGFDITVTNTGAGTATGIVVSDDLPAGADLDWSLDPAFTGCAITGLIGSQTLDCTFTSLAGPSGSIGPIHVTSATTKDDCAIVSNTADVSAGNDGTDSSTDTVTVQCGDIHILKTANPAGPVSAGTAIGFDITVTNTGAGTATGIVVSDDLPAGADLDWSLDPAFTGCAITGLIGSQTLDCTFTSLAGPSGSIGPIHVTSATTKDDCAIVSNTADVSAGNDGTDSSTDTVTVQCGDIHILKTANPAGPVSAGTAIGFDITVTNTGAGTATGIVVSDDLPAGADLDWSLDPAFTGCAITGLIGSQTLDCTFTSLAGPSGSIGPIHVTSATTKDDCAIVSNTADVSAGNDGTDSSTDTVTVQCGDIHILKTANPAGPVSAGTAIGFDITVTNTGAGTATGIVVSDDLPAGADLDWSLDPAFTGCAITGLIGSQTLDCTFTSLAGPSGSIGPIHVTSATTKDDCAIVSNTADVSAGNDGTDSSTASITVNCPNLTLTKDADDSPVNLGDTIGFTIKLSNGGPGDATDITVHDPLPGGAGADWSVDSVTSIPAAAFDCVISGTAPLQAVDCGTPGSETDPFTLPDGASIEFHVTSDTSSDDACNDFTLSNTVTVEGLNIAVSPLTATASITVNCPNLTLTKDADDSPVNLGDTIGFTIKLSNGGPGDATDITVHDPLPGGAGADWSVDSVTSIPAAAFDCVISGTAPLQAVDCGTPGSETDPFTLPDGASIEFHVTSDTSSDDACNDFTLSNTVTVEGLNIAVSPLTATASITVNCPNLTLTKDADDSPVNLGDTIGFTIKLSNGGPGDATDITVHDPLPGGAGADWSVDSVTSIPAAAFDCVISGTAPLQAVDCGTPGSETDPFTLPDGASIEFHVTSDTSSPTACQTATLSNTVTVEGLNIAVSPLTATASITVNCPNTGLIAPTQTTCQQYASHTALPEPPLSYGVKHGKINNVAPGVIFYFTTITVTTNNTAVSVSNASNTAGFPPIGIQQDSQAYVFTTGCVQVKTMTVNGGTATTSLNPGTYIIQIKYSPGSLVGTSVPSPSPTVTYTFTTKLNNVTDGPSTATIQLIPK